MVALAAAAAARWMSGAETSLSSVGFFALASRGAVVDSDHAGGLNPSQAELWDSDRSHQTPYDGPTKPRP